MKSNMISVLDANVKLSEYRNVNVYYWNLNMCQICTKVYNYHCIL